MKITDAFRGEHGAFYAQFDHLEQLLATPVDLRCVQSLAAMLAAALAPHARMEDELLFDAVAGETDAGVIEHMYEEHAEIEALLGEVARATDDRTAVALLCDAIARARLHFLKEEQVAFALAEATLSTAALEALGQEWAERRTVVLA